MKDDRKENTLLMMLNAKKKEVKSLEEAAQKHGSGLAEKRLAYYDKELDDMEEPWKAFQNETEQFWQEMDACQREWSGHKMHLKN